MRNEVRRGTRGNTLSLVFTWMKRKKMGDVMDFPPSYLDSGERFQSLVLRPDRSRR